jgi:hypothetical protein
MRLSSMIVHATDNSIESPKRAVFFICVSYKPNTDEFIGTAKTWRASWVYSVYLPVLHICITYHHYLTRVSFFSRRRKREAEESPLWFCIREQDVQHEPVSHERFALTNPREKSNVLEMSWL